MIRILSIEPSPWVGFLATNAGPGGTPEPVEVPLLRGRIERLPAGLEALLLLSDIQAMDLDAAPPRLAGEAMAERVAELAGAGELPAAERTGVLLAGDLWSDPACAKRGGLGDVTAVWTAFAREFRWVAGVLGNHDRVAGRLPANAFLLDGELLHLDGLAIGGVAGIAGNPRKPNRRAAEEQSDRILELLLAGPDLLVLHEPPEVDGRRGSPDVRAALDADGGSTLVVCGHCHWSEPLVELPRQVLNVDGRMVLLSE